MSHRFFVETPIAGSTARLVDAEAQHLSRVMRASVGDEVTLFDGSGAEFIGRVQKLEKAGVLLEVIQRQEISRELPFDLTLAVALPKGDRQKWLVEKATELGVTRLVPLITQRGVAQPVEQALERLARQSIEAAKQCGRNWLLQVAEPRAAEEYFAAEKIASPNSSTWIAHPGGVFPATLGWTSAASGAGRAALTIAIGPEGGFTDEEVASALAANWQKVSLGERILRIETAALALAAWAGLQ